jgi:hypothetical protein
LIAGVNRAIAGTLIFKGGYDAATNTPDLGSSCWNKTRLDVCSYSCWYLFFVEAGDLIISKQNAPTTLAHYTVNKNIPLFFLLQQWYYNFSYSSRVNAGVDANKAVTPVTLQAKLNLSGSQTVTRNVALSWDAAATSFVINHGLNTRAVLVSIHRNAAP